MRRLAVGLTLLALPILEIALLIRTGQRIGLWPTLLIIFATGALGIVVLVRQRFAVISGVMTAVNEGRTPLGPVLDGAFLVLAGGLLFSPGLISDVAGLLLLISPLRRFIALWSMRRLLTEAEIHSAMHGEPMPPEAGPGGPVIDGEFERLDERAPSSGRIERKP